MSLISEIRGLSKNSRFRMNQEDALQMKLSIQLFTDRPENLDDTRLVHVMDNLISYKRSGWCTDFEYWHVRRRLTDEWSKRLRARG